ncbi:MAG: hypothetical protein CVV45_07070 [Spirochaetae bacterium HGW-Spirochaetae-10]|jgi:hypothetical protein|nr:MAG: hypothetical protein CVV45_07070 [Spirochaetae bacterium HGW-Spirochaetae-10]
MNRREIREQTIVQLKSSGVEIPAHLPLLEADSELSPKNGDDVARKIAALGMVIGMGYGADHAVLIDGIESADLWPYVSPREAERLKNSSLVSDQDRIDFQWLAECVYAFAWCLDIVELNPTCSCPDNLASLTVPGNKPAEFVKNRCLRPMTEILQQADLHYCLHWHERQRRLEGLDGLVGEGIVWERRRALDWVIGVSEDWDNMPADT